MAASLIVIKGDTHHDSAFGNGRHGWPFSKCHCVLWNADAVGKSFSTANGSVRSCRLSLSFMAGLRAEIHREDALFGKPKWRPHVRRTEGEEEDDPEIFYCCWNISVHLIAFL